jgi:serine/threonine protein kinase
MRYNEDATLRPKSLGRFEIRGEIGRGNMGVVYRAFDPVIDRLVAIKALILPEAPINCHNGTFLSRFFLEAKIAGKLIHPNIVITHDAAKDDATETPFIVMELVEGESLGDVLKRQKALQWREALNIAVQLAHALDYAHQNGIVHRDIKPSNVILTKDGIPKIVDFGIAKLYTANLTQTDVIVGTPVFMSPEQLLGESLDGRSDLFSLGSVVYNLVVGRPPFEGSNIPIISSQVLYRNPPPISEQTVDVPKSLDGIIARAMAKHVEGRYSSSAEFAQDLISVLEGTAPAGALPVWAKTMERKLPELELPQLIGTVETESASLGLQLEATPSEHSGLTKQAPSLTQSILKATTGWKAWAWIAAILSIVALGLYYYRQETTQHTLFIESKRAAEDGEFVTAENKLEELLKRNPNFEGALELMNEIGNERFIQSLPLEFTAKHSHRIGSCTGRLIFHKWGVEYLSEEHDAWRWPFVQIHTMRRGAEGSFHLETNEGDLLGLLKVKNYNFSIISAPFREMDWQRYERLYKDSRLEGSSNGN